MKSAGVSAWAALIALALNLERTASLHSSARGQVANATADIPGNTTLGVARRQSALLLQNTSHLNAKVQTSRVLSDVARTTVRPDATVVKATASAPKRLETIARNQTEFVQFKPEDRPLAAVDLALADVQSQESAKKKELAVQQSLVNEKQAAMLEAQNSSTEIGKRADELRKEADVAATIAKEKLVAAAAAQKDRATAEVRYRDLKLQSKEIQKFLNQTAAEERVIELKIKELQLAKNLSTQRKLSLTLMVRPMKFGLQQVRLVSASKSQGVQPSTVPAVPGMAQRTVSAKSNKVVSALSPPQSGGQQAANYAAPNSALEEASVRKLKAENQRLKHEKLELERRLVQQRNAEDSEQFLHRKLTDVDSRANKQVMA